MKLSFLGAARTVTGSQFLLETGQGKLLVDCGMHQGPEHFRHQGRPEWRLHPTEIDWLLLTHAHIDHSGNIPLLARLGFGGPIYTTAATADLCGIMLADSAHIQEEDAEIDFRKWKKRGRVGPPPAPAYTQEDVAAALKLFHPVKYESIVQIAPGIKARWRDAGHILGAASIELWVQEKGREIKLIFSGDIGQSGRPLLRDPELLDEADFVIMESTYGNRRHEAHELKLNRLQQMVQEAARNHGHIIIPSFAVGRTQELLYELNALVEHKQVPLLPVYVDSPLAISATEISERHRECFDKETQALLAAGDNPMEFPGLKLTREVAESKAINLHKGAMIVIASSGMCTGGRIRHHLRNHLEHGNDIILFVGYQAAGTLGRLIHDGAKSVKLFSEWYSVRARVRTLHGFSAHADADGLLKWLEHIKSPQAVFVVHGEEEAALDFAAVAHHRLGAPTVVPDYADSIDLESSIQLQTWLRDAQPAWNRPAKISEDQNERDQDT